MVRKRGGRWPDGGAGPAQVSTGSSLTDSGRAFLLLMGFEAPEPGKKRRNHLAGKLADQLYLHLVAQGWARRRTGRDVAVAQVGLR